MGTFTPMNACPIMQEQLDIVETYIDENVNQQEAKKELREILNVGQELQSHAKTLLEKGEWEGFNVRNKEDLQDTSFLDETEMNAEMDIWLAERLRHEALAIAGPQELRTPFHDLRNPFFHTLDSQDRLVVNAEIIEKGDNYITASCPMGRIFVPLKFTKWTPKVGGVATMLVRLKGCGEAHPLRCIKVGNHL